MFGYPGERHRDVRRTMALLRRLRPSEHSISVAYPMPGTEFYERVQARMPERLWKNRDDAEPQFETDYSPLYLRLARAIARRRYAPGHPRDLIERVEGWLMEVLFFFVRWRDEITRRRRSRDGDTLENERSGGRSEVPGSTEPRGSNATESRGTP